MEVATIQETEVATEVEGIEVGLAGARPSIFFSAPLRDKPYFQIRLLLPSL